jgi:general secretion pathway protein G
VHNEIQNDDKNIVEAGFTLVELLIVIVIMGILAGIVVFAVGNLTDNANTNACATEKKTQETALEAYKAQTGSYPANAAALKPNYLKEVPTGYASDNTGAITAIPGNTNGCA